MSGLSNKPLWPSLWPASRSCPPPRNAFKYKQHFRRSCSSHSSSGFNLGFSSCLFVDPARDENAELEALEKEQEALNKAIAKSYSDIKPIGKSSQESPGDDEDDDDDDEDDDEDDNDGEEEEEEDMVDMDVNLAQELPTEDDGAAGSSSRLQSNLSSDSTAPALDVSTAGGAADVSSIHPNESSVTTTADIADHSIDSSTEQDQAGLSMIDAILDRRRSLRSRRRATSSREASEELDNHEDVDMDEGDSD